MKNKLVVESLDKLSVDLYDNEYEIDSEQFANELLTYLAINLQKAYDLICMLDSEGYFDDETKKVTQVRNEVDLYQIGDVVNLLNSIEVEEEWL